MSAVQHIRAQGVAVSVVGGRVRLTGLAALPPERAEQVVAFARQNRDALLAELGQHTAPRLTQRAPQDPAEALALLVALLDKHPGLYLSFGYPQDRGPAFALQPGEHPAYSEGFKLFLKAVSAIVPRAGEMRVRFGGPREPAA